MGELRTFGNIYTLVIFYTFVPCVLCDFCVTRRGFESCKYGCCNDKCCGFPLVAIVPIVIGGLILLGLIVSCAVCVYCVCKRPSLRRGNVVQPHNNINTVSVHNTYGNAPPLVNPPPYNQVSAYPGSSSQFDAANPSGSVTHPPPAYTYTDPNHK